MREPLKPNSRTPPEQICDLKFEEKYLAFETYFGIHHIAKLEIPIGFHLRMKWNLDMQN